MPGLTQRIRDDEWVPELTDLKSSKRPLPFERFQQPRATRTPEYDSYSVANGRAAQTTGYGLNEPQWTDGPPPVIFRLSPYARVPLPSLYTSTITLDPVLTPTGMDYIMWAICENPVSGATRSRLPRDERYHWKSAPAAEQNVISLTIMVEPFPTPIVVLPAKEYITIWEVLAAIYNGVRRGASDLYNAGTQSPGRGMWSAPRPAATSLVDQRPESGDDELSSLVRSYMNFNTRWVGLVPSPTESDVWVLQTKPLYQR